MAGRITRNVKRLGRVARKLAPVLGIVLLLAAGVLAVKQYALDDDATPSEPASLRARVLAPGTFTAVHPYAPYYVVPEDRISGPSKLSPAATAKFVTQPDFALQRRATAGSPQIVRFELRTQDDKPVTVESVRASVVSDARPLKGWFIATAGCAVERTARVARLNLDVARKRSRRLGIVVGPRDRTMVEIQAASRRSRVAWVFELTVSGEGRRPSTVTVDDSGEPFRVTSPAASRAYEPVYGATGISGFGRRRAWDDGIDSDC